ncbi:hypothetical protein ABZ234_08915 [Nocardiopsis sp. NPDC006198]|uniref:hypothetical protein n=1 Tax=Nocardiopsis sp. NPDC006198 TaxID=3154472 RepID=UPI0033AFDB4B
MKRMILTGAALLLAATACGQQETTPRLPEGTGAPQATESPEDRASPDPGEGDGSGEGGGSGQGARGDGAHVLNMYGDENGFDDQRPVEYVATEFTSFSGLEWPEWTDETASGTGDLYGTWCMDRGCQDEPYEVEVELGDPVDVNGTPYFSTYTITGYDEDMTPEVRQALEDADGGRLSVPTPE